MCSYTKYPYLLSKELSIWTIPLFHALSNITGILSHVCSFVFFTQCCFMICLCWCLWLQISSCDSCWLFYFMNIYSFGSQFLGLGKSKMKGSYLANSCLLHLETAEGILGSGASECEHHVMCRGGEEDTELILVWEPALVIRPLLHGNDLGHSWSVNLDIQRRTDTFLDFPFSNVYMLVNFIHKYFMF